jgi:hypothetical protein
LVSKLSSSLSFTLMSTTHSAKHDVPELAVPCEAAQIVRLPSVDEIVHDQAFYIKLCEEQSIVFR